MFSRQRGNDTKIKLGPSGMKEEYQKKEISGENNGKLFLSTLKYVSTLKSKHNIVRFNVRRCNAFDNYNMEKETKLRWLCDYKASLFYMQL